MKKRVLFLGVLLMLLTGCTKIESSSNDYQSIIGNVISYENSYVNNASIGYKYYLPKGIKVIVNKDYNQTLKYFDNYIYLYVDIVSYYYKNNSNLSNKYKCSYEGKIRDNGYFCVIDNLEDDKYYVRMVNNYSKIEFYSDKKYLNNMITYGMIILNSVRYNDITIESILNNNSVDSSEINYEIKGPNNDSDFSQYLEEYIEEDEEELLPDE